MLDLKPRTRNASPLKILQVIPAVAPRYGGPSQAIFTMCRALQAQGVEVLIATTNADGSVELPVALGEKIMYQDTPAIFFDRQWSEALKYSRPLALWLERNVKNFDLAHIHAVFSHACVSAARACGKNGVPYVVRPLGTLDPWSLKQKSVRKRLFWHLGVKQMLTGAAAIHYTSDEERRLAEAGLGLSGGIVIPNGLDLSFVNKNSGRNTAWPEESFDAPQSEIGRAPYVLALSRIHPKKGFELLIESFAMLRKQHRFGDWSLIFAGAGDEDYINRLKDLARQRGLNGAARFVGWLDGAGKYAALKGASLLAMPSYQENFGISLIEAMACGVPVLVSPHVNLAPDIERACAGWIAELSQEKLAGVLAEALDDVEERQRRGAHARALAQTFAAPLIANSLVKLYQSLNNRRMQNDQLHLTRESN
jgi:glycosyltransferase involved in cell wall biosynthesis